MDKETYELRCSFENTKKFFFSYSPEAFLLLIVFDHLHILGGSTKLFFYLGIQNEHEVICRGFFKRSRDSKSRTLYLHLKHTFKDDVQSVLNSLPAKFSS